MTNEPKLLPCPFCGGEANAMQRTCDPTDEYNPTDRAYPVVQCKVCYAQVCGGDWQNIEVAIAAWNRRHHPVDATAMVAPRLWDADSIKDAPEGFQYGVGFDGINFTKVTKETAIAILSLPGSIAYGPLP